VIQGAVSNANGVVNIRGEQIFLNHNFAKSGIAYSFFSKLDFSSPTSVWSFGTKCSGGCINIINSYSLTENGLIYNVLKDQVLSLIIEIDDGRGKPLNIA
jgi:hypothetical protein